MNKNSCVIRLEKKEEQRAVENLIGESFWDVYRPGCYEHFVLHILRNDCNFVPELNFVMEKSSEIIGQIVFVKQKLLLIMAKKYRL